MIVLYESAAAQHNQSFIDELKRFCSIELLTWEDWSDSGLEQLLKRVQGQSVFFRVRQPHAARFLEDRGVRLINRAEVNRIANDKWQSYQLFQLLGVPVIPTQKTPLALPYIAKTANGHGGKEVWLVESEQNVPDTESPLLYQPVVPHRADVRAYVIGKEIVGAVKRSATESFKANYSLGASAESFELTAAQRHDVEKIVKALKSDYIGIDFLLLEDGRHVFNELEDPVGARSFYQTHDDNIAELLAQHFTKLEQNYPFRDSDRN
ncbi:alpha-L-glutamate ligase [Planococcus sp. CP5-4]|uniref:ATP-grasp domain-containing protein n=1 Tax=unclassified Planococcus (in: firmicutes) TaxID=2662419 RepID=UPI001C223B79|nr:MULTISPECIES: alpha-L-glutamate ligase [unclassified Planococcus (in: firmicutes)]MBU9672912.1 alpha-L-glutamate ligase [Planococcus sp. CP5-4_YE]MBV0908684.1 alpha-L-glutamate ligase [Planococcus sp. CP5-4_UN]MBW6063453.1 alpha-L-glutamate ligase [Planococcus sp. CP5-4]